MITVNKTINILSGVAPFTYQWSTDDGCVTFSKAVDIITGTQFQTDVYFEDETCLTDSTVTLTITSDCGNSESFEIAFSNPCDNFTLNAITLTSPYTFDVTASRPGCTATDFTWTYDTSVFNLISKFDNNFTSKLILSLKTSLAPDTTVVKVKATDCTDCLKEAQYTYVFCVPQAQNVQVHLYDLDGDSTLTSGTFQIPQPIGCPSSVYDWSTADISPISGFTYTNVGDGVFQFLATGLSGSTYVAPYNVSDETGVKSKVGYITFIMHYYTGKTLFAPTYNYLLDCTDNPGDTVYIPLEDNLVIQSGASVDWTTFQVINPPTPVSTSISLYANMITGKREIAYVIPDPIVNDSFAWTIKDTNGIPCDSVLYTVIDCAEQPIANDDSATVACGSTVEIDVISNDQGNGSPIDPSSVTIVTSPTGGTCTINTNGTITYAAPNEYDGEITFTYKVKNASGSWSDPATVTVTVECAGTNANVILCN